MVKAQKKTPTLDGDVGDILNLMSGACFPSILNSSQDNLLVNAFLIEYVNLCNVLNLYVRSMLPEHSE